MAAQKVDNTQLESLVAAFAQDRKQENYAKVMDVLEKSVVLVPAMQPQGIDDEM